MITLSLIIYVAASIYFSIQNMRGYVVGNEFVEPSPALKSILAGLVMPIVIIIGVSYYIVKYVFIGLIIVGAFIGAIWILTEMP